MTKTVWITGASSGIGESLALEYSKKGYNLILSARREDVLLEVKSRCLGDNVAILPLDLASYEKFDKIALDAISKFGSIDILVNNGGISQRSFAHETVIGVDEKIMKVNYLGTIALTKSILPHMILNKSGQIVTITSMVGKFGTPLRSTYSASKHALHGFMDSLRAELYENGIKVCLICPGFIKTNVSLNALTGSGRVQGTMDKTTGAGIEPQVFALRAIKSIESGCDEVIIAGLKEKFGYWVNRICPRLFRMLVRKLAVT
jgi:short-subunit dehydrogenase